MLKKLPHVCPSCASPLRVKSLICEQCSTEVSGEFELPLLASLSLDDQMFIIDFVKHSGSLKLMAEQLKLSYPTVRNLLDDIIKRIGQAEKTSNSSKK
ncbi:MAG TPA: DUF2089 family protein [Bacteroidia bacterium]|jgi:hypothetical protein|nr:DUF2089 family protein [Bacteroidia bacterium]